MTIVSFSNNNIADLALSDKSLKIQLKLTCFESLNPTIYAFPQQTLPFVKGCKPILGQQMDDHKVVTFLKQFECA
jgi:hypothetical protein